MKVLTCLCSILGISSAFPVIHHSTSKNYEEGIYFPTSDHKEKLNARSSLNFNYIDSIRTWNDRIHFPAEELVELSSYKRISNPEQESENSDSIQATSRNLIRFRHSLSSVEDLSSNPTEASETDSSSDNEPTTEETEQTNVPLTFLEQWAKKNSQVALDDSNKSELTETPTDSQLEMHEDTNSDNPLGFHSLFTFQKFSNRKAKSDCPNNELRNHNGKCVKILRISTTITTMTNEDDKIEEKR